MSQSHSKEFGEPYRRLFETVPDVVYTLSPDGLIASLNPAFERITGWARREWIGKPFGPLIHPEDLPIAVDMFHRVLKGETPPAFELRIVTRSGEYRIGELHETPELNGDQITAILGMARDVTDLKRTESILRDNESQYRLLFAKNPHLMWVFCADSHHFLDVNDTAIEHFGYSKEKFLSMTIEDLRLPEDRAAVRSYNFEDRARPPALSEAGIWRLQKQGGAVIQADITWQRILFSGKQGVLVLAVDVTERQRVENALRESETRFRSIMDAASDAMIVADTHGTIVYVNRSTESMFGYATGELRGKNLSVLMPERYREAHFQGMRRVHASGEAQLVGRLVELQGLRKDGGEFPIELSLAVWEGSGGMFCSGIVRDITARKQSEHALRDAHDELERRVTERTRELASANQELHEKVHELELFHDVVVGRELKMIELEKELTRLKSIEQP